MTSLTKANYKQYLGKTLFIVFDGAYGEDYYRIFYPNGKVDMLLSLGVWGHSAMRGRTQKEALKELLGLLDVAGSWTTRVYLIEVLDDSEGSALSG